MRVLKWDAGKIFTIKNTVLVHENVSKGSISGSAKTSLETFTMGISLTCHLGARLGVFLSYVKSEKKGTV